MVLIDCIDFIIKTESITNNGYCHYFESTSIYSDFSTQVPNIKSLCLIGYNGSKKVKNAHQTIAPIGVCLLSDYLGITSQQSYLMLKCYDENAKRFDLKCLNEIKEQNILIINNDKIEVANFQSELIKILE
jgi:hypothetical protein